MLPRLCANYLIISLRFHKLVLWYYDNSTCRTNGDNWSYVNLIIKLSFHNYVIRKEYKVNDTFYNLYNIINTLINTGNYDIDNLMSFLAIYKKYKKMKKIVEKHVAKAKYYDNILLNIKIIRKSSGK